LLNQQTYIVSQKTSRTFSINSKKDYQILIFFGTNISETIIVHQINLLFSINVCFCTT